MQKIDVHIYELLADYDCVVIPELGGFVANPIPARIDKEQHLFLPPARAVVFNQNLLTNDGLLVNKVAAEEEVDYKEALSIVREYVILSKTTLQEQGRFELDALGVLYYDQEKNLCFQPDENLLLLPDAYGLSSFYSSPVEKNTATVAAKIPLVAAPIEVLAEEIPTKEKTVVRKAEQKPIDRPAVQQVRKADQKTVTTKRNGATEVVVIEPKRRRKWPVLMAAGAFVIGAFYMYHVPVNTSYKYSGQFELAQLFQFGSDEDPTQYTPRTNSFECDPLIDFDPLEPFTNAADDAETIRISLSDEVEKQIIVRMKEREVPARRDNTEIKLAPDARLAQHYQIIGGCFRNKSNAENLVSTMNAEGHDAVIFDLHNGLYRVSLAGYSSRKEAKAARKALLGKGISTWVLKH